MQYALHHWLRENGRPCARAIVSNFSCSIIVGLFFIHSFRIFYRASPSPLLLRGAPDYSIDAVSELTRRSATDNCELRTCQSLYVSTRVDPTTVAAD